MKSLRAIFLLTAMAAVILFAHSAEAAGTALQNDVIYYANIERVANGLAPLRYAGELDNAAEIRANEVTISFSHRRPDGSDVSSVLGGVKYSWFGENLAVSQVQDAQKIVRAWMNSTMHRANLLNRHFTQMAVACVRGNDGRYYWAQMFSSDD